MYFKPPLALSTTLPYTYLRVGLNLFALILEIYQSWTLYPTKESLESFNRRESFLVTENQAHNDGPLGGSPGYWESSCNYTVPGMRRLLRWFVVVLIHTRYEAGGERANEECGEVKPPAVNRWVVYRLVNEQNASECNQHFILFLTRVLPLILRFNMTNFATFQVLLAVVHELVLDSWALALAADADSFFFCSFNTPTFWEVLKYLGQEKLKQRGKHVWRAGRGKSMMLNNSVHIIS